MLWGHWVVGITGAHLQTFTDKPTFTSEPSLTQPVGNPFEIHANNRGKPIADLEIIYRHELPGKANEEAA
jgi:hypothetical protein